MQRDAAKKLIQDTFEQPFNKEQFTTFAKNLLNHLEPAPFPRPRSGQMIFEDFRSHVASFDRVGKFTDADGNKLDVLIVYLSKGTSLDRARSTQRKFVAKYLKESQGAQLKDAALVAFVSPNEEDWRFSFVKMDYKIETTEKGRVKVKEEFTPARRYSFLVGQNENSHTAQSQLLPILENTDQNPTLADLEVAFKIEKVTKEFFEQYRELYHKVKDALDKLVPGDKEIRTDFEDKGVDTVDFAKKLLGQIVFLYFLQKKGWFGVKRKAAWGTGSKGFLRELFSSKHGKYKNFFNDILEPLFYNTLAVERPENYADRFDCKIPFLNGGLFDPLNNYDWVNTDILLPNDLFSNDEKTKQGDNGTGILDVFDRYNFTVKEDEPLEKEVAVDPEMLGKVFENLLEVKDRKSKGTYYTPREIVHYMCQESLINYLATELGETVPREDIETLIKHGETAQENDTLVSERGEEKGRYKYKLPEPIRDNAKTIDQKLADIKVCDPAVGSGAFLVGMMSEIVRTRMVLTQFLGNGDRTAYDLKRHAIQNSLYGVDIDLGAVEIAKLRLWLSLIVDEDDYKQIKPLPNLDYKIMQGNSLLEEYEGIKLIDERFFEKQEEKAIVRQRLERDQSQIQRKYIQLNADGKLTKLRKAEFEKRLKEIDKTLKELDKPRSNGQDELGLYGKSEVRSKADRLLELHEQFFSAYNKREKDQLKKQIEILTWNMIEVTLKQQGKEDKLNDVRRFQQTNTRPFFLWRLNFADVFSESGGFDVVIANPPYLESRHPSFEVELKSALQTASASRWGQQSLHIQRGADLLIYFFEVALHEIKSTGLVVFLTQNSWLDTEYGRNFQEFLLDNTWIKAIVDSDFKYFDSKTGPNINTVITVFQGTQPQSESMVTFARLHVNVLPYAGVLTSCGSSVTNDIGSIKRIKAGSDILRTQKWGVVLSMSDDVSKLMTILREKGRTLSEMSNEGITVGQGLNLTKDFICDHSSISLNPALREGLIPIFTSADGAPFSVRKTTNCLLDASIISKKDLKEAGLNNLRLFKLEKTSKKPPKLILPRGIGRHFCAINDVGAYSASAVDIYCDSVTNAEDILLRLWLVLNSSIGWLFREITGRKNLGGGMLKAEAVDLKRLPIYLELPVRPIKNLFNEIRLQSVKQPLEELNEERHSQIDQIVCEFLKLNPDQTREIVNNLEQTIKSRQQKARS